MLACKFKTIIILRFKAFLAVLLLPFFLSAWAMAETKGIRIKGGDAQNPFSDLYSNSYALVIGVSRYTAGWPNLESIPVEIETVENALRKHDFVVNLTFNPTSKELKTAFDQFINDHGFDRNNRLLFFFSGHGYSRHNGTKGYLVPADAPDPRTDTKAFLRKAIAMSQVLEWARRIESKHALFVFDSCFSGTIFKSKSLPEFPPHITDFTSEPVRQFISAGSAGEQVPAKSVFAPSFIRALRGEADLNRDNFVTGTELGMYLHQKVLSYRSGQTPQYGKIRDPELDEGDIVFSINTNVDHILSSKNSSQNKNAQLIKEFVESPAAGLSSGFLSAQSKVTSPEPKENKKKQFVIRANGIILDTSTGLEWVVGPDKNISFREAKRWAEKLTFDGGGWRLPSRSELRALYHRESWSSSSLPKWVTFPKARIWTNYFRDKMIGGIDYYYYFNGKSFTTSSDDDNLGKRALSVRVKKLNNDQK
ncbi:MAG: caspase family protein [Desulfobacteraceae bacterium]